MKRIFISWSGEKSREMAFCLKVFLNKIFSKGNEQKNYFKKKNKDISQYRTGVIKGWLSKSQYQKTGEKTEYSDESKTITWMSSCDINDGQLWYSEINDALRESSVIVVCLTKENINSPWLLFESGRVFKDNSKNSGIIPFLVDLDSLPFTSPLFNIQYVYQKPDEAGACKENENKQRTKKFVSAINSLLEKKEQLNNETLEDNFSKEWEGFLTNYLQIRYKSPLANSEYTFRFCDLMNNLDKKYDNEFYINADMDLINMMFYDEYQDINEDNIGKRIQYIVDRVILFVYLETSSIWAHEVDNLRRSKYLTTNDPTYQISMCTIEILSKVFEYHILMTKTERDYNNIGNPEDIYSPLNRIAMAIENESKEKNIETRNKNKYKSLSEINSMIKCMLYDYLGLTLHKMACLEIGEALGLKGERNNTAYSAFYHGIEIIQNTTFNENQQKKIKRLLTDSLNYFDKVLEICKPKNECYEMFSIWLSFAEYNKARVLYILYAFNGEVEEKSSYREVLISAIENRKKDYLHRYSNLPSAIRSSFWSEYLEAVLELCRYEGKKHLDIDVKEAYEQWRKGMSKELHRDVLKLGKKIDFFK